MTRIQERSPKRRARATLFAALTAGTLLVTACSSDNSKAATTATAAAAATTAAAASETTAAASDTTAAASDTTAAASDTTAAADTTTPAADPLGEKNPATGAAVKVGLFNVEGGAAVSLPDVGDAAVAAAAYANDYLGGLGGHKIEIVRCADKADGASATACANQFVEEGVVAVVAGQPATADNLVPVVAGAGIPYVGSSPAATTEVTTKGLTFFSPGFLGTLSGWATYAKDQGWKSFGVFLVDNPQAVAAVQALGTGLFAKAGVTLQVNTIPQGTADATSVVQAGLALSPDAVGIVGDNVVCQAVLQGLVTAGNDKPVIGISPCLAQSVRDAVGEAGLNGMLLFDSADTISDDPEAVLYRDVMSTYAPKSDPTGITPGGYVGMLGFVRAANAGGLTGDVTPATVAAALAAAKDVPVPAGRGEKMSCDASVMGNKIIQSTICFGTLFLHKVVGTDPSTDFTKVDSATLFQSL